MILRKKSVIFVALSAILLLAFAVNGMMERQRQELLSSAITEGKVLGEATLVDAQGMGEVEVSSGAVSSDYFANARINRQKARDAAIEVLQDVIDNRELGEEAKRDAASELGMIATILNKEGIMENLIKAKGFSDCVVVVGEADVTVVVQSKGLTQSEVSKIKEIVVSEAMVGADNIKIIEVK
ncbi:MAG: SpoIIIAH-like family protein [Clostridiales bacterium]|nr:SpoIIIAH-like family protein [Clostridiales bacterium]